MRQPLWLVVSMNFHGAVERSGNSLSFPVDVHLPARTRYKQTNKQRPAGVRHGPHDLLFTGAMLSRLHVKKKNQYFYLLLFKDLLLGLIRRACSVTINQSYSARQDLIGCSTMQA